jgi:hypothetical protein
LGPSVAISTRLESVSPMFKTSIIDYTPRENIMLRTAFIDRHQGHVPVVHSITDLPSDHPTVHCCKFTLVVCTCISDSVRTDAGTADRPHAGLVGYNDHCIHLLRTAVWRSMDRWTRQSILTGVNETSIKQQLLLGGALMKF